VTTITSLSRYFLPGRLRNVLTGRLERTAQVADFEEYAKKRGQEQKA
jgi:hypothetical protein